MKSRITPFLFLALAFTLALAPALAVPVNYGTGIYHWALTCGPFSDGHWTVQYVGSSVCPNSPPPGCTCTKTIYDFPYNNPYPYLRINTGFGPGDPGTIHVILDETGAIQCGTTVKPPTNGQPTCGAPFITVPTDPSQVDPNILDEIESLVPDIEQQTGSPVQSFEYSFAYPSK
jgi:hypothetical protein